MWLKQERGDLFSIENLVFPLSIQMMENVGPLNLITRDNVAACAPALR